MQMPLPMGKTVLSISILLILIFSKYIYMASLSSYYTFYLIDKFGVSVQDSQLYLFVFLVATAIGTLMGGPIGDRIGRKYVIWGSTPRCRTFQYADASCWLACHNYYEFLCRPGSFICFPRHPVICAGAITQVNWD